MEELEETCCEIRRTLQLHNLNWHTLKFQDTNSKSIESCKLSNYSPHLSGGFLDGVNYVWLSCGPKLVILNVKTGTIICCKSFRKQISCVSPFPSQSGQLPLLLVGLDNRATKLKESSGIICVFDCISSQILRSVRMPASVEKLCVINGGAEWETMNENRVDNRLLKHHGLACVALKNLDYFMIDLRRNRWEPNQFSISNENYLSEIYIIGEKESQYEYKSEEHVVLNLMNEDIKQIIRLKRNEFESPKLLQESFTSVILYSEKIGCIIAGCLGRVLIWQNNCISWISPFVDEMIITHIALLEPADDPKPFCYLWVSFENKLYHSPSILKMYALLFQNKFLKENDFNYLKLEAEPSLKFELELQKRDRIINLIPILRGSNLEQSGSIEKRGENSLLLISVEGKIILFDLNQWYKEQMPRSVSDCHNINSILAIYQTKSQNSTENIVNCAYSPSTLKEFSSTRFTSPEEFYYPYSLSLDWIELGSEQIIFWATRGLQAQLLRKIVTSGSLIMSQPSKIFHRCVTAGLISSSPDNSFIDDIDSQRDSLLTLCLEQRSSLFLLKCAKEWYGSDSSHMYSTFVRWSIQRASEIKDTAHKLCHSLFDQSGHSIGEAEIKHLRFLSQQMECLCNVVEHLPKTEDIKQQYQAFYRIAMYLEILLWFYDVGLLPEVQNTEGEIFNDCFNLRIPYPVAELSYVYNEKRKRYQRETETNEADKEILFIDELISRECPALRLQWEQERNETDNGDKYPPPSLQSLIRSCLTDCYRSDSNEIENKHQIIIYLLMDLVMLLHNDYSSVDQLIKYPSAFKLSPSLIKLTHALWYLDHEDYQGFFDTMIGQLVLDSDIKNWHHEFILRTLLQCNQNKLASVYIRIRKPPLLSINDQSTFVTLSIEHGLVQSIFHKKCLYHNKLLIKFFRACQLHGKLSDILHLILSSEEEKAFMQFLEQQKYEETQLLYYLQRCRYIEANNILQSDQSLPCMKKKKKLPVFFTTFQALNATLPEITQQITENLIKTNKRKILKSSPPRPMSHVKSCLSRRETCETAIKNVNDIFFRKSLSRIPFLSAPSLSLDTTNKITNSNCVRFAKNVQLHSEKRSLDQIMTSNDFQNDGELKKRCKITASCNEIYDDNTEKISLLPIQDTPLIKRKHHIMHTADTPCETPQSILKIRQMIQNSSSSSGTLSSLKKINTSNKEKKPRQIRFNIYQSINNESIDESLNNSGKSSENQVNVLNNSLLVENKEIYPSPNTSTKSLYEESILKNISLDDFKHMTSSHFKPHLKRKHFSESCQNSFQTPFDHSLKSNKDCNTSIHGYAEETHNVRPSSPSTSIYASTILSSDSSFEFTSTAISLKETKNCKKTFSTIVDSSKLFTVNNSNEDLYNENGTTNSFIFQEDDTKIQTVSGEIYTNDVNKNTFTLSTDNSLELNDVTDYKSKLEKSNQVEATQIALKNAFDIEGKSETVNSNISDSANYVNSLNNCNNRLKGTSNLREINHSKEAIANCYENSNMTDDEPKKSLENDVINMQNINTKNVMNFMNSSEFSKITFAESISITDNETDKSVEVIHLTKDINTSQSIQSITSDHYQQPLDFDNIKMIYDDVDEFEFSQGKRVTSNDSNQISPFHFEENNPHSRMTRLSRASSVIPIIEKSHVAISKNTEVPKFKNISKEQSSLLKATSKLSSKCFKSRDLLSAKKERSRRSRSLNKDVLMNTTDKHKILDNSSELIVRRSTRISAVEQKKLTTSENKTDSELIAINCETIEESAGQLNKITKTTKSKKNKAITENSKMKKKRFPIPSQNNGDQEFEPFKTRNTSILSNAIEDMLIKKSVFDNKIIEEDQIEYVPLAKRTRSASISKENTEERLSKKKCLDLNSKKIVENASTALKKSDNVSMECKKNANIDENITKKVIRQKRSNSEEITDKSIKIKNLNDDSENPSNIIKSFNISITPIPEENEITDSLEKQTTVTRRSRQRRAMSVDFVPPVCKRQSREFSKNTLFKNSEKEKELHKPEFDICMENNLITKNLRRSKRAKSETKELKEMILLDNLKQNSKKKTTTKRV